MQRAEAGEPLTADLLLRLARGYKLDWEAVGRLDAIWLPGQFGNHARVSSPPPRPAARTLDLLCVSTIEPRKNALYLLDWFTETAALPDDAELWWVGPLGWMTSRSSRSVPIPP